MSEFEVGDRIAAYGSVQELCADGRPTSYRYLRGDHGKIVDPYAKDGYEIEVNGTHFAAHPKQCRKLVKREPREWVINQAWLKMHGTKFISDREFADVLVREVIEDGAEWVEEP